MGVGSWKVPRPTKKNPHGVVSGDVWDDAEAKVDAARKRVKAANPKADKLRTVKAVLGRDDLSYREKVTRLLKIVGGA